VIGSAPELVTNLAQTAGLEIDHQLDLGRSTGRDGLASPARPGLSLSQPADPGKQGPARTEDRQRDQRLADGVGKLMEAPPVVGLPFGTSGRSPHDTFSSLPHRGGEPTSAIAHKRARLRRSDKED
jgi:hypothetical protein